MILIVGVPFTGKTISACTFPKPALLLDFDDGFESVKNATDQSGKLIVPDWKEITVVKMINSGVSRIDLLSPSEKDFKIGRSPDDAKGASILVEKYNKVMDELFIDACITIDGEKKGPFQTLIIDPLTTVFQTWKDGMLFVNRIPALRIGDYKTLTRMLFSQFVPNLKSLQEKIPWIICIDHETIEKDELTGGIKEFPIGPSYTNGRNLPKAFSEVFRTKVESSKYVWRTKAHGRFEGAGSRFNLPDPLTPPTFETLSKYLKGKG